MARQPVISLLISHIEPKPMRPIVTGLLHAMPSSGKEPIFPRIWKVTKYAAMFHMGRMPENQSMGILLLPQLYQ